uniref:Uncharacterized protein n=1 Tax=Sphaerodactylus townsendi TaxID=933632 RepID=A0ACB8GAC3_9SAUR
MTSQGVDRSSPPTGISELSAQIFNYLANTFARLANSSTASGAAASFAATVMAPAQSAREQEEEVSTQEDEDTSSSAAEEAKEPSGSRDKKNRHKGSRQRSYRRGSESRHRSSRRCSSSSSSSEYSSDEDSPRGDRMFWEDATAIPALPPGLSERRDLILGFLQGKPSPPPAVPFSGAKLTKHPPGRHLTRKLKDRAFNGAWHLATHHCNVLRACLIARDSAAISYDEEFRRNASSCSETRWDKLNQEAWTMFVQPFAWSQTPSFMKRPNYRSRPFCTQAMRGVSAPHHHIRLTQGIKEDLGV